MSMRHLIQDKLTDAQIAFINSGVGGGFLTEAQADLLYEPIRLLGTVTTTNATVTTIYSFTPSNGVYIVEANTTGINNTSGDAIGSKLFATFKVIAGVVTQVSTNSSDRKSNFPASVTIVIDTDATLIRVRVTGKAGETIVWKSYVKITV